MNISKLSLVLETGLKTLYFNFKYLPFKQAIRFPILLSRNVRLHEMNGRVIVDAPLSFGIIKIGYSGVGIFDYRNSKTIWQVSGTVIFKGKANIGQGSKISVGKDGKVVFGSNFTITAETAIVSNKNTVTFGDDCLLSWDCLIMDTDFHKIKDEQNKVINEPEDVTFGKNVWVGCRCLVLKGSIIPDYSIISASSLVNGKLVGEHKIFGGQPARELKNNVSWEL